MGKTLMLALTGAVGLSLGAYAQAHDTEGKEGKEGKEKMEISGPVTNLSGTCPELEFTVATQQVETKDKTDFDDLACDEIANGTAVEVEGWVKEGVLMAREVQPLD